MKKLITLLTLVSIGSALQAQTRPVPMNFNPTDVARQIYNSPEWTRSFVGSYGVNPGVEPGVPDNEAARALLGQVRTFLEQGTDEAVRQAFNAMETFFQTQQTAGTNPSPMLLQIAGTLALRLNEVSTNETEKQRYLRSAETYLKRAIDPTNGFPNFLRAHKNLANLLFRAERSADAKEHFIKAIQLGDNEAVTYGLLGAIYMEEGKLVSSESALRQAIMLNPAILEFKQLLGNVLLQQDRYNEAKELFDELLALRPNDVNFWMAQSNSYVALDMIDEAATNLEIIRFMGKANAPMLMLLGDVYMNKEMIDEAAEVYVEAIRQEATQAQLMNYIRAAETLNNFGAYEAAITVLDEINSTYGEDLSDENQVTILSLRSEVNIALDKGDEAARNLEDIVRRDPFNGRALLSLARYYGDLDADEGLDENDAALQESQYQQRALIYYERAQNLDNDEMRLRAFVGEAQLRVRRNQLELAVDLLRQAQNIRYQDTINSYLQQIQGALRARRN